MSNFTLSNNNALIACPIKLINLITKRYLAPVTAGLGIAINLFGSLVFYRMTKKIKMEGHMFKYLLVKTIDDLLQFVCQIFSPLYYCLFLNCDLENASYAGVIWYIWFFYYFDCSLEFASSCMEVMATFDFYCLIKNKFITHMDL